MSIWPGIRAVRPEDFPHEPYHRLCVRAEEFHLTPMPGSVLKPCSECGQDVWYHPGSTLWAPGEIIICTVCMHAKVMARNPEVG